MRDVKAVERLWPSSKEQSVSGANNFPILESSLQAAGTMLHPPMEGRFMRYVVESFECGEPPQKRVGSHVGDFGTLLAATLMAELVIDASLRGIHEPNVTATHLFACWSASGQSARIVGASIVEFDAYTFAKGRCEQLCRPKVGSSEQFLERGPPE